MGSEICLYCILFMPVMIMIPGGLIYIFKKDWAWAYTQRMLKSVRPQRTPEWETYSTINGVILLVVGILILIFIISILD